jgi:hypothetical protein
LSMFFLKNSPRSPPGSQGFPGCPVPRRRGLKAIFYYMIISPPVKPFSGTGSQPGLNHHGEQPPAAVPGSGLAQDRFFLGGFLSGVGCHEKFCSYAPCRLPGCLHLLYACPPPRNPCRYAEHTFNYQAFLEVSDMTSEPLLLNSPSKYRINSWPVAAPGLESLSSIAVRYMGSDGQEC